MRRASSFYHSKRSLPTGTTTGSSVAGGGAGGGGALGRKPRDSFRRQANPTFGRQINRRTSLTTSLHGVVEIGFELMDPARAAEAESKARGKALWELLKKLWKQVLFAWRIVKAFGGNKIASFSEPGAISSVAAKKLHRGHQLSAFFEQYTSRNAATRRNLAQPSFKTKKRADGPSSDQMMSMMSAPLSEMKGAIARTKSIQSTLLSEGDALGVLEVCNIDPRSRTHSEIHRLAGILAVLPYFEAHKSETVFEIAKIVSYRHAWAGEYLFNQGDTGRVFYVIISGSVSVMVTAGGIELCACSFGPGDTFGSFERGGGRGGAPEMGDACGVADERVDGRRKVGGGDIYI
jgi:hypothetical protein